MDGLMSGALHRYGVPAVLEGAAGTKELKVFFHPIQSSAWQNMNREFTALGEVPNGKYLCVMPADAAASPEDTLRVYGQDYLLRKVEQMYAFGDPLCCWCLCVEKGSEDAWGLNGSK